MPLLLDLLLSSVLELETLESALADCKHTDRFMCLANLRVTGNNVLLTKLICAPAEKLAGKCAQS